MPTPGGIGSCQYRGRLWTLLVTKRTYSSAARAAIGVWSSRPSR